MDNNLNLNPDLENRLKELNYFFNVLDRAVAQNKQSGTVQQLTDDDVKNVLRNDLNRYNNLSPKLTNKAENRPADEERARLEEAKGQVEVDKELRPLLSLIAGIDSNNRLSDIDFNTRQQMGAGMVGGTNNALTHPKLAPYLDQAASSFLDAYRQIQDEQKPSSDNNKDAPENKNELTLQYKNAMKNRPEFKPRLEAKPAPQYVPTVKPHRPF